jgi:hypothetical protein
MEIFADGGQAALLSWLHILEILLPTITNGARSGAGRAAEMAARAAW